MRLLGEVVNFQQETLSIKRGGNSRNSDVLTITVFDADYPASIFKVHVWDDYPQVEQQLLKGVVCEIRFQKIKAANQFEPAPVINCHAGDIRFVKDARAVLRELQEQLKHFKRSPDG